MKNLLKATFFAVAVSALCLDAQAWSLFGSSEGNTQSRIKAADKLLEKADIAFGEAKYAPASNGYARAMERYQAIDRDDPKFGDGLPAIRVAYCADQIDQCAMAATGLPLAAVGGESGARTYGTEETSAKDAFLGADGQAEGRKGEEEPVAYDPRNFAYDFAEARDLVGRGRAAEAIDVLVPMVRYDAGSRPVRMLLAAARLRAGQTDLAIATLEDLRGRREDLPLLLLIAGAYASAGRYPDALFSLDAAVKLAPADPDPYLNLAWLTLVMNESDPSVAKVASDYYRQALKRGAQRDAALEARL